MRTPCSNAMTIGILLIALTGAFQFAFDQEALAAERICPGGVNPDPNVVWCDDFEGGGTPDTWSWSRRNPVLCTDNAFGFASRCAAWTGTLFFDGYWGYNGNFGYRSGWGSHTELYNRMYVYFSPNYQWGNLGEKGIYFERSDGTLENVKIGYSVWGTGTPNIQSYAFPENVRYQNQGRDITFQPGQWYLVEWYIKLNTPGVADGVIKVWIDDATTPIIEQTLRLHYDNLLIRGAGQDGGYDKFFLSNYQQRCDLNCPPSVPYWMKWDQIVVSKAPIGPMRGFQEDFETATTNAYGRISGWDGPASPSAMYLTDQASHSGRRSLELKYDPRSYGAGYMYKYFSGQDQVYHRWYQRWSPGFLWDPVGTSMVGLGPATTGYPWFGVGVLWGTGELGIGAQAVESRNFYQNQGPPVIFQPERWYCVEVSIKLNTPGVADGELATWIDGELKLLYTGRQFRGANPTDPAPATAKIETAMISGGYYGTTVPQLQFSWQDDHVVSTHRVGCQVLKEDFDMATTNADGSISGWDGPANPSTMYLTDRVSLSGRRSLELRYDPGSNGAGDMSKYFSGQDQVYHRWYQGWSPGFLWDPVDTSMVGLGPLNGYPHFGAGVLGGTGQFGIEAQTIAEANWDSRNFYQNQGTPVVFQRERWYCIEVFIKLNTPGVADGELAAWIDGELKLLYTGRQFRGANPTDPAPATAKIEAATISGYYSTAIPQLQFSWHENHVASTHPVGCH